ncbi:MAG TPA: NAD(P)-dependent alcohol dehydrogenase [Bryobacteraceae bacterium]|nr:NAD(P)-dependent alcohol dehydrogenase [Bryobacteraceae bacterium]
MKAAVLSRYGPPDVVQIRDVEKPVPQDNQVLIKVRAASVNPLDWSGMRGEPYIARLMGGLRRPKDPRLGADVAGEVEAVGKNVAHFKPGDEVFGTCRGAFAEYACASELPTFRSVLALKPANVTFEQAAAVPVAGLTALQGLRDKGRIQPGQKVLINGAAGGVGTFAVQIGKSFGAEVTGVCSTRNVNLVRSLGADRVIDYTQEDFTKSGQRYDLLLDCVGNHPLFACKRVLNPKGICVVVGAPHGGWLRPLDRLLKALMWNWFGGNFVAFIAKCSKADLTTLGELIEAGKATPAIDKCYRLSEVCEAIRYQEEGHARGKVVITVSEP